MNAESISPDLKTVLRRLKLSRMLDTLPERLALARQQKMPHQDFLLLVLPDEASRRDGQAATLRAQNAQLDPEAQLEPWDETAKVSFDRALLNELASLRFLEAHHHVADRRPRRRRQDLPRPRPRPHRLPPRPLRPRPHQDKMLKTLRHARLTNTHEAELRDFLAVDLLIVDDFGLDAMDAQESRDAYEILTERHRAGSDRSSPPTAAPTSGSPPSPTRSAPRAPSTASPATPTTSSSRASPTAADSSPPSLAPPEGPMDADGLMESADGFEAHPGDAVHPSHKPLESRPTTAGFPQRPQVRGVSPSTQIRRACFDQTDGLELHVTRRTRGGIFLKRPGPRTAPWYRFVWMRCPSNSSRKFDSTVISSRARAAAKRRFSRSASSASERFSLRSRTVEVYEVSDLVTTLEEGVETVHSPGEESGHARAGRRGWRRPCRHRHPAQHRVPGAEHELQALQPVEQPRRHGHLWRQLQRLRPGHGRE